MLVWNVVMTSWQRWMSARLWCKWSFDMASWMLARLQYKWSVVVASWKRWMLARLRCKWSFDVARCKYWCNFNVSASANVECCRGFMGKMNVGIASIRMKCCRSFMAKMNCWPSFMASVWVKFWTLAQLRCKWSVVVASWQKWMLAQLQYEWSVDVASMQIKCWGSFMKKKRVLVQLHYKSKWWCDFIANASANIASWQKWMLAWLQYKNKCWHSFMVKAHDVGTLQRLLKWLRW